jgi:hypothetical protein
VPACGQPRGQLAGVFADAGEFRREVDAVEEDFMVEMADSPRGICASSYKVNSNKRLTPQENRPTLHALLRSCAVD